VVRLQDQYYDQQTRNGHDRRLSDLEAFAALGLKALRFPVLWERSAQGLWPDLALRRLRDLGVRPIATLLHHGSGPPHTSLVDDNFPRELARYAGEVARRYPWIEDYTPVNEPLTTARFSCLYGHWYPHQTDTRQFFRALMLQLQGVSLAMRAIRQVNPGARLIQTEDLGKTHSTERLRYQADFENERRWLVFDLLGGWVRPGHALYDYLHRLVGISERELAWFVENPCPPDIYGANVYLTSERWLDEDLSRYPPHTHGGNGRHRYADVEAVRAVEPAGPAGLLAELWQRYRNPFAITEVHNGSTREEQIRWVYEVAAAAQRLRSQGADVRAITLWSLLGSYDWNSLLTRHVGFYESGVFDLRGGVPRPTALAGAALDLAHDRLPQHPVASSPGWWRRPERLLYPARAVGSPVTDVLRARSRRGAETSPESTDMDDALASIASSGAVLSSRVAEAPEREDAEPATRSAASAVPGSNPAGDGKAANQGQAVASVPACPAPSTSPGPVVGGTPPLLITGARGTLGRAFVRIAAERGLPIHGVTRHDVDVADPIAVTRCLSEIQPWAVINTAGYVRVDEAESDAERCFRDNRDAALTLASACVAARIPLLTFSSDLVFDGSKGSPYLEGDRPRALSVYGRSKAEAEVGVLRLHPGALVVRTSAFFGPWDQYNFVYFAVRAMARGEAFAASSRHVVSPTYVPHLVHACLDLLIDGEHGLWHLANSGETTWYDLASAACELSRVSARGLQPIETIGGAPRPCYSALGSERAALLPPWQQALEELMTTPSWREEAVS
jgi:dTDP-4-dehydrorhamnose reductase